MSGANKDVRPTICTFRETKPNSCASRAKLPKEPKRGQSAASKHFAKRTHPCGTVFSKRTGRPRILKDEANLPERPIPRNEPTLPTLQLKIRTPFRPVATHAGWSKPLRHDTGLECGAGRDCWCKYFKRLARQCSGLESRDSGSNRRVPRCSFRIADRSETVRKRLALRTNGRRTAGSVRHVLRPNHKDHRLRFRREAMKTAWRIY